MGKINRDTITKTLKKMAEKAREDARIHGTYIVYKMKKVIPLESIQMGK